MNIVEDTFYQHDEHGRVKVAVVDAGQVFFEKEEQITVEKKRVPAMGEESVEEFTENTEPAPMDVGASTESLSGE